MPVRKQPHNYYRLLIQWIIIILLTMMVVHQIFTEEYAADFEAFCPFGGMQSLSSFLVNDVLACSMTLTQIAMGIGLILAVILFSKLFCSYICPIGTFSEWLGKIGDALKMRYTIKGKADIFLRSLKYALLFVTFYFTISSGELFCKKYDPYYVLFSGFSSDVDIILAIISLFITVAGAIFIRLFWCKYLCPLGAATNIFANTIVVIILSGLYALLVKVFGLGISWVWLLAAICIAGFILEALRMTGIVFPLMKITRNNDLCTSCKRCDKACPMGLNISKQESVKHIDCHLCGDCLEHCPEKGCLKINKRNWRWIPPVAIVVIVAAGIYISDLYEIPTVNKKWGTTEQMNNAKEYVHTGLKNIKCFGSASSFVSHMQEVEGVLGVAAFVKSRSVKILYDPAITNPDKIKQAIFKPVQRITNIPENLNSHASSAVLLIHNFFDSYDAGYLTDLMQQQKGMYGFETTFGEPVETKFYFDSTLLNANKIKEIIELPEYKYQYDGKEFTQEINFKAKIKETNSGSIPLYEFMNKFISPADRQFNNFSEADSTKFSFYKSGIPEIYNSDYLDSLDFLVSHISFDNGIVRLQTEFTAQGPVITITYLKDKTEEAKVKEGLRSKSLKILYEDGSVENMTNPFKFPE